MRRRPRDELRQRRERLAALAELRQHALDHPEAFDPARLPSTPQELQAARGGPRIGRPPADDLRVVVPLRLPTSLLAALDDARSLRDVSRSTAICEAVAAWVKREAKRRVKAD